MSVNTPLCKTNSEYLKTLEFIRSLGVRFVTASGLICTGMAKAKHGECDLNEDELYKIVSDAKAYCDEHDMEIDFTSPGLIAKAKLDEIGMNVSSCGAALSNMAIAPNGEAVPCQSWLSEGGSLGNILSIGFDEIWNGELCKRLRAMNEDEALLCPFREGRFGT